MDKKIYIAKEQIALIKDISNPNLLQGSHGFTNWDLRFADAVFLCKLTQKTNWSEQLAFKSDIKKLEDRIAKLEKKLSEVVK